MTVMEEKIWRLFEEEISEEWLKNEWKAFWWFLVTHSILETQYKFGQGIIDMIKEYWAARK